jgi:hypothetical protein
VDPPVAELVAKESIVAAWHLQRRTDWVEIKQRIFNPDIKQQSCFQSFSNCESFNHFFLLSWLAVKPN